MTKINKAFEYRTLPISELQFDIQTESEAKAAKTLKEGGIVRGGGSVKSVLVDGDPVAPSARFWSSLYSRFNINKAFFRFFDHSEVFDRIAQREANPQIRVTVERDLITGAGKLLAATGTNKPVIIHDDLIEILEQFSISGEIGYDNGVITTTHTPKIGRSEFNIGPDRFSNKFVLHAPIDGFGTPNFYLSMLRKICSNGMIGWAKAFKTSLQLGSGQDDIHFALERALDGFTNDEGFAKMRDRFATAQQSWASLREQQELYNLLIQIQNDPQLASGIGLGQVKGGPLSGIDVNEWKESPSSILRAFEGMTGTPFDIYFRNPNVMSGKRQRTLPVQCKVYDMINFATEIATHHVSEASSRKLQAWVGEMLSAEYDLEDSCQQFTDFRDMFLQPEKS